MYTELSDFDTLHISNRRVLIPLPKVLGSGKSHVHCYSFKRLIVAATKTRNGSKSPLRR